MKKHRFNQKDLKHGPWKGPAKPELIPAPKPLVRKAHKETLRLAHLASELNRLHPEPMTMMRKREKEIDSLTRLNDGSFAVYRKPQVTLGQIDKAATAAAEWDLNDPFAYGRTALHVKQGYLDADMVIKEMSLRTIARRSAKAKEVDSAKIQSHA